MGVARKTEGVRLSRNFLSGLNFVLGQNIARYFQINPATGDK